MSQETIEKKLEYLDQTKQLIGQALVTKGQTLDAETPFRDYVQKVLDIETGFDTRDATAVASEVLKGKTFYNSQGKVEGTLVPKTGDIKKFETVEEMQNDANAQEGDLAIVYKSQIQNADADTVFNLIIFPDTVVLPEAVTDFIYVTARAVDTSVMCDFWGNLDSSRFSINCYTDSGSIYVEYESTDGLTYTRIDTLGNPVEFPTDLYFDTEYEPFNDLTGYFMQINGAVFNGLYQYKTFKNKNKIHAYSYSELTWDSSTRKLSGTGGEVIEFDIESILNKITEYTETNFSDYRSGTYYDDPVYEYMLYYDNNCIVFPFATQNEETPYKFLHNLHLLIDNTTWKAVGGNITTSTSCTYNLHEIRVNITTGEISYELLEEGFTNPEHVSLTRFNNYKFVGNINMDGTFNYEYQRNMLAILYYDTEDSTWYTSNCIYGEKPGVDDIRYLFANTQFTLKDSNELLPGKIAYGKNGIVEGKDSIYNNLDKAKILNLIYKYPKSFESENYKIYSPYKNNLYISNTPDAFPKYYKKDEDGINYIAKAKNLTTYKDFIHLLEIEKDQIRLITYDSLSSRWVIALKTGLYIINKDKTEIEKSYSCTIYEAHRYIAVLNGYVIFKSTINDIIGTYALDLTTLELNTLISGGITSTEFALNNIDNTNIIVSTYTRDESPSTSYHIGRLSLFDINVETRTITKLVNEVSCYTSYFSNYYIYPAVPNFDNHFYILLSYRQSSSSKDYKYIAFKFDKETQTYTTLYDQIVSFLDCNLGSYSSYSFRRNPIDPVWYSEDENYIYDIMLRKKFPIGSSIVNASSGVSISIPNTNISYIIEQASNDVLFDSQGTVYRATPGLSEINYDVDNNKLEITNLSIPYKKLGSYNIFQVDDDLILSLGSAYGNLYNLIGNKLYLQNTTYYAEFELTRIQEIDIAKEQFDYILINTCISSDNSYIASLIINNNHNVSDISDEEYQTALDTAYSIRDDATE